MSNVVPFRGRDLEPEPEPRQGPEIPVDSPAERVEVTAAVLHQKTSDRRPVLPRWMTDRDEFREIRKWARGHAWYKARFHGVRIVSVYPARVVVWAPVGAAKSTVRAHAWVTDTEGRPVRSRAAQKGDAAEHLKLMKDRDKRFKQRGLVLCGLGLLALIGLSVALAVGPAPWTGWGVLAGLSTALAWIGRPADRPLFDRAVIDGRAPKLTSGVVIKALLSLRLPGMSADAKTGAHGIEFPSDIKRDGPGWRADVDLPDGVTWGQVAEKRQNLASALKRPLACVWPEGDTKAHPGRLVLWVGDQTMSTMKPPSWPLAREGRHDYFKPLPFGFDQRGRPVWAKLFEVNWLVGGIPGSGKTYAIKVPFFAAALDPTVQLWFSELKGTGDGDEFEGICHRYVSGADDDAAEAALQMLRDLLTEAKRRAKVINGLPRSVCPEKKVTRELADRKALGLFPIVAAFDECQELFAHSEYGKEASAIAVRLIKLSRAFGITTILGTQRPDKDSLPTGVSANVAVRYCLRVNGWLENDMVLGTSMHQLGYRATTLADGDEGTGYFRGSGPVPFIARSAFIDVPTAKRIIERATTLRMAAGTITGHAAGEAPPEPEDLSRILIDVLGVWDLADAGGNAAFTFRLAELLAERYPARYSGWDAGALGKALRARGVEVRDVHRKTADGPMTRPAIDRRHVAKALESGARPAITEGDE